ncbi:hypothetical protein QBC47DRAFT_362767 [Echria macrotheca]|uniref:Uncharacterized protein n=1 Tax=Echria macrotheca TaxID=438768 RepID=A0AAJ0F988_9PEZI|nr:hypothetical protein QBC47DRAFT_362767 [Echria macrotheca]
MAATMSRTPAIQLLTEEPIEPIAQLPDLSGWRLELVKELKKESSVFTLTFRLDGLIEELKANGCRTTAERMQQLVLPNPMGNEARLMWDSFHTIPREVLNSVVLNTVAYDKPTSYPVSFTGVYVMGIALAEHDGKFLNAIEMDVFIENLTGYIEGSRPFCEVANPAQIPNQFPQPVKDIDNIYGTYKGRVKTRCIPDASALENAQRFLEQFRKRKTLLEAKDPTRRERALQSPLYVGCSRVMDERVKAYDPSAKTSVFNNANRLYALTMSLLQYQGLQPRHSIVAAVRTWQPDQLGQAEMLVTALAGAYVFQGGFNCREAGGASDRPGAAIHTRHSYSSEKISK